MSEAFGVTWTRAAVRDLDEILEYIAAERGVDQALHLYETLRHSIASLAEMPRRCRQVPEFLDIGLVENRAAEERPDPLELAARQLLNTLTWVSGG